ncbi:MAG: beta-1,3-glucanase family protein [Cyclobacteriaceae bacterium]
MNKSNQKKPATASYVEIGLVNSASANLGDPYVSLFATVSGVTANFYVDLKTGIATFNKPKKGKDVFKLSALTGGIIKLDKTIDATAGRIYFSSDSSVVTSATQPDITSADFYFDWVEFALVGSGNKLVANTTQVDQFGFPIKLTISPADANFGATAGSNATRSAILSAFKTDVGGDYDDCLFPVPNKTGDYYRILSPNQAIVNKPGSKLADYFTTVIDDFFTYYTNNKLYLAGNVAYPYEGQVTTVSGTGTDNKPHDYHVLQFKLASDAPINKGLSKTPPSGAGPFNIYYPFFTTNNPAGHGKDFNGGDILPPPKWWGHSIKGKGSLNEAESPSQMIFAGNGIFADTFWQLDATAVNPQTNLLGNLENQLNVAFNRGHATSWFTLSGSIAPGSAASAGGYTSTVTLDTTDYSDQNTPKDNTNVKVGMQVLSQAAAVPLEVTTLSGADQFDVKSPQPILAQNTLYVSFADFYPSGGTWNAYGEFFHKEDISIGGRAYALSFDDQGGFSSTLTSVYSSSNPASLKIELLAWT